MTGDFERVRHSAQASVIARTGRRVIDIATTAWGTSAVGGWWTRTGHAFARATPVIRLRWWAITIGVGAVTHVVLRSFMSSTVAPAMPLGLYAVIAAGSAVVAWQADAFSRAWRGSRVSRAFK